MVWQMRWVCKDSLCAAYMITPLMVRTAGRFAAGNATRFPGSGARKPFVTTAFLSASGAGV